MAEYRLPTATMDLVTLMDVKKKELAIDLKVSKLGIIDSYDPSTGLASVKIQTKFNEKTPKVWDYPIIPNVPVLKSKYFSFPINKGDGCLLIFLDTDFTAWLEGGEVLTPASPRLHNLNDVIAIMGVDTKSERPSFGNDNIEINADSGKIDVKNNSTDLITVCQKLINLLDNLKTSLSGLTSYGYDPTNLPLDIGHLKTEIKKLVEGTLT